MSQIFLNLDILNFVVLIDVVLLGVEGKEGGSGEGKVLKLRWKKTGEITSILEIKNGILIMKILTNFKMSWLAMHNKTKFEKF